MPMTEWKSAGAGTNDSSVGDVAWSDPGNITASNDSRATCEINGENSQLLRATDFGFTTSDIPNGATILGIEIGIERHSPDSILDNLVSLRTSSGQTGDDKSDDGSWPSSDTEIVYGGASDDWNAGLSDSDIRGSDFGVVLQIGPGGPFFNEGRVDHIRIRVTYEETGDDLTGDDLDAAAPTLDQPALSQTTPLTGDDLTASAPLLDEAALGQVHAFSGDGLDAAAPLLGEPALSQVHVLAADGLDAAAPVLDEVALGQVHALAGDELDAAAPVLDAPTISTSGTDGLSGDDLDAAAPVLDAAALSQVHALAGDGLGATTPTLDEPALSQTTPLTGDDLAASAPTLDAPALGQVHALTGDGLDAAAALLDAPMLAVDVDHPLSGDSLTAAAPLLDAPELSINQPSAFNAPAMMGGY